MSTRAKPIIDVAKKLIDLSKVLFYALTLIFPIIANRFSNYTAFAVDYIIAYPAVFAIAVIAITFIINILSALTFLKFVSQLYSVFHLAFSSLVLSNIVSSVHASVDAGLSKHDAVINVLPTMALIIFGLLFVYIASSDSYSFGKSVLRWRDNRNSSEASKSLNNFRKIERRGDKNDLFGSGTSSERAALWDFDKKQNEWISGLSDKYPNWFDLTVASFSWAAILAVVFTVASYFIFIYSDSHVILTYAGDWLICESTFIIVDIAAICLGSTYEEVEDVFVK